MDATELKKTLFGTKPDEYESEYVEHLLEQYRLYVQSHENVSDRRLDANKYFVTLNTALIGALGYLQTQLPEDIAFVVLLGSVAGSLICYLWYRIIRSYRGLNTGKFEVIHAIEERLPLSLYDTEWKALGEGKDKKKYLPVSHIEEWIPRIFIALYVFVILFIVNWSEVVRLLSKLW